MDEGVRRTSLKDELAQSAAKLELGAVLALVAAEAESERTARSILSSSPLNSIDEIVRRQDEILELIRTRQEGLDLPIAGWRDSAGPLARISVEGMAAPGEDLSAIAAAEKTAQDLHRFLQNSKDRLQLLTGYLGRLNPQSGVVKRIENAIGPDYEVLDRASPDLARLRRSVGKLRTRLRKACADYVSSHSRGRGEEFVTVRGDRFVVSLPREGASTVKGIVHHESGSGASLFIEPLDLVEENNRLEAAMRDERDEVLRILAALTSEVYGSKDDLVRNQDTVMLLDSIRAAAKFAERYRCVRPDHSSDGALVLRSARHPLLEKKLAEEEGGREITGLDLECGPGLRILVISGPNAGGKTVALKTIGLMVMMDRLGLLLPCLDGTVVPDNPAVFVDIGDDQSIEKSLSTFSSRVLKMNRILEMAGPDSLVLIDEIGDGTDPEEGAALAGAMLEHLSGICGRCVVTTHMNYLKGWAHDTGYAENATLEFDPEELRPIYRMRMGVPGRSWGIETAARMGLPAGIIEKARDNIASPSLRLEELLSDLERTERLLSGERERLMGREEELKRLTQSYRDRLDNLDRDRENLEQKARTEALEIVKSTRVQMERVVKEIRASQAEHEVLSRSVREMRSKARELEREIESRKLPAPVDAESLETGQWVMVSSLGKKGRIKSVEAGGKVTLELPGGIRVETRADDLSSAEGPERRPRRGQVSYSLPSDGQVETELMIRGMERAEAMERIDAFIDNAVMHSLGMVTIIHGIGRGVLKRTVYDMLKDDPRVADIRPGEPALGGDGIAIVRLR